MSIPDEPEDKKKSDLRQIPLWARRYAEGRGALPDLLLAFVPAAMGFLLLFIPSWLALSLGYSSGAVIYCGLAAYGVFILLLVWKQWQLHRQGTNIQRVWTAWFYRREGHVRTGEAGIRYTNRWLYSAVCLGVFYGTYAFLGHHLVEDRYAVPVSAIWLVPFLWWTVRIRVRGGPPPSPLMLIAPAWYALHALLILLGVPLYRTGDQAAGLTVFPSLVFGLVVASLASFVSSRVALRRLRATADSAGAKGKIADD
jgi:hypothetical protein